MREQLGDAQASALCDALCTTEPSVSIRLNPWKYRVPSLSCADDHRPDEEPSLPLNRAQSREQAVPSSLGPSPIPWCPGAYYMAERPPFTFDPLLHAGAYYVQDASSMFLAQVLSAAGEFLGNNPVVLDLCAAPGGKSTLLRSLLPQGALLVCNEPIPKRAQVLAENMTKWGHPAVVVTQNYPADFAPLSGLFDMVVADVPCSGEGMFRKDEGAVSDWSLANVDLCWRRQRDILSAVWPALKPGGCLVYSTCTFNHLEDEDNVRWIARELGADVLPVPHQAEWGIQEGQPGYHFYPHRVMGEGFYVALLRKHKGESGCDALPKARREKSARPKSVTSLPREVKEWVAGDFELSAEGAGCTALPAVYATLRPLLRQALRVLSEGIALAQLKGNYWQPAHALAMSTALRRGLFPEAALSYEQALAYLRHEAIQVDAPRGFVLVTFRGFPLGFVKNLGPRANNLYPQEWRIRSGYTTPFCLLQ